MLSTLLASSLLLVGHVAAQGSTCQTGTGKTQEGNNYVVDSFTGQVMFSYAINQCTSTNLLDTSTMYKYTCGQDTDGKWMVTKTAYTSSDCSGDAEPDPEVFMEGEYEPGEMGYFKCDGVDSYAAVEVSTDTSCAVPAVVYGGLGGCAVNSQSLDTKFYCDQTSALVQLYNGLDTTNSTTATICDDDELYCTTWVFGTECDLSARLGTVANPIPIYGKMKSCNVMTTTSTTGGAGTTTTSSASTHFTVLSIIVALIASLMH